MNDIMRRLSAFNQVPRVSSVRRGTKVAMVLPSFPLIS